LRLSRNCACSGVIETDCHVMPSSSSIGRPSFAPAGAVLVEALAEVLAGLVGQEPRVLEDALGPDAAAHERRGGALERHRQPEILAGVVEDRLSERATQDEHLVVEQDPLGVALKRVAVAVAPRPVGERLLADEVGVERGRAGRRARARRTGSRRCRTCGAGRTR
jgi:hypothetical protein